MGAQLCERMTRTHAGAERPGDNPVPGSDPPEWSLPQCWNVVVSGVVCVYVSQEAPPARACHGAWRPRAAASSWG